MGNSALGSRIFDATKWSLISEISVKVVTPFSFVILARILTPEAFGLVATLTMVISFGNLFSDAGFQKFLLQASFKDDADKFRSVDVAFWSNLIVSISIYLIVIFFRKEICKSVGSPELELGLVIACLVIPLSSLSSLQNALFRRELDFRIIFRSRILGILIPLFVTIPIAFLTKSYWALIVGTLLQTITSSIYLTSKSPWKPSLYFSWRRFKSMIEFGIWITIESVLSWLTSYLDIFLIGLYLSAYYLGLYKTSLVLVDQLFSLLVAGVIPVLTPVLSKFKGDKAAFDRVFLRYQKVLSLFSFPLGIILIMNSSTITYVILGEAWLEASRFIGIWALMTAITLLFIQFKSAALVAIGSPKYLVLSQLLYIILFIPIMISSIDKNFEEIYTIRTFIRLIPITISIVLLAWIVKISFFSIMKNIFPAISSSLIMCSFFAFFGIDDPNNIGISFLRIFAGLFIGLLSLVFFKQERTYLSSWYQKLKIITLDK